MPQNFMHTQFYILHFTFYISYYSLGINAFRCWNSFAFFRPRNK
jgi:hypothetical protein